jgi:energy-coupling factor transport system permease protein
MHITRKDLRPMRKETQEKTFVELLDPRTKFVGLLLLSIQTLTVVSPAMFIATSGFLALTLLASPISVPMLGKQLKRVFWFALFITVINALTVSGRILVDVRGISVTYEGVMTGLLLSARIALVLLLAYSFVQTTTIAEMLDAVEKVVSPLRSSASDITLLLSLTLNFIPLLIHSARQIKMAQIARGADVDSSLLKQLKFASSAALPLFVSAFRSSQQLADAIEARCYRASVRRTPFSTQSLHIRDRWTLSLLLLTFILVLSLS